MFVRVGLLAAASLFSVNAATADDWTASKLRGQVLQLVGNQWVPLQRGDVVPDTRYVATTDNGHVELTRGGETIALDPSSRIRIFDKGGAKPFTTVKQDFGTVAVEANVENVQHFAVQTQYLAAVVKGTRFIVTSGKTGASVSVRRGHVEVDDQHNQTHVTLSVGQSATVDTVATAGAITVAGDGKLPQVLDKKGEPVSPPNAKALAKAEDKAAQAALKAAEDAQKRADELGTKAAKDAAKDAAKEAKGAAKAADKADKAANQKDNSAGGNGNGNSDKGGGSENSSSGNSGSRSSSGASGNNGNAGNGGGGNGGGNGNGGGGNSGNGNGGGGGGDNGNGNGKDKKDKKDKGD